MLGVVITFDDVENLAWLSITDTLDLQSLVGRDARFELTKTRIVRGKAIRVEEDMLVVKFEETPLGLGQGSQVFVSDEPTSTA